MGMRKDLIETEAAHQILNLRVRLVETGIAERHRSGLRSDQLCRAAALTVSEPAFRYEIGDRILEAAEIGLRNAKRVGANDLDLAHRDAARDLGGIFAKACDQQKLLEFAEPPLASRRLAQSCIWRKPSTVVASQASPWRRVLGLVDTSRFLDLDPDTGFGRLQNASALQRPRRSVRSAVSGPAARMFDPAFSGATDIVSPEEC